jgi:hypothetical protein
MLDHPSLNVSIKKRKKSISTSLGSLKVNDILRLLASGKKISFLCLKFAILIKIIEINADSVE